MKQIHKIKRRFSRQIFVGDVAIGGDAPISVQSMTNTDTCDVDSTISQINSLKGQVLTWLGFQFQLWRLLKLFKK